MEVNIDDGADEVETVKIAPDPGQPTKRQIEEHRIAHWPYRSWCRWCALGRGRGLQHRGSSGSAIPIVGFDYFYLTKGGVKRRDELDYSLDDSGERALEQARARGDIVKCILVRCLKTKAVFAHVIQRKGVNENDVVIDTLLADLAWLGHTRIIVKADGEPALQALVHRVMELAKVDFKDLEQMTKEDPATYDSQSNGGTEVGVRLVRGMLRTIKLCLEQRIDKYIPVDHPVMAWMVEHVCLLLNVLVRGEDGATAWARVRGRAFAQQLLGFAETVLYRFPSKGPQHAPDGNIGALGKEGIFLGFNRGSNTFHVATADGYVAVRSISRVPEQERWKASGLEQLRVVPGDGYDKKKRDEVRFGGAATEKGPTTEAMRQAAVRRLRINQSDLDKHGYDTSCPQCKYIQRYGRARAGGAHSERCRGRIVEALSQDEEGRARLQIQEDRITQAMSERIERSTATTPTPASASTAPTTTTRTFLARAPDGDPLEDPRDPAAEVRREPHRAHDRDQPVDPEESEVKASTTASSSSSSAAPRAAGRCPEPPGPRRTGAAPPAKARVTPQEESSWQDVDGGAAAPTTPTACDTDPVRSTTPATAPGPYGQDEEMIDDSGEAGDDVEMEFIGSMEVMNNLGKLEPSFDDEISNFLLAQMGSSGKVHQKDASRAARRIVSEIYSPPRVTELIKKSKMRHVLPGYAFDLTVNDPSDDQPWDFSLEHKRERARRLLREQKPYLLVGSPECRQFSTFQAINTARSSDRRAVDRARTAAIVHIDFVCELYQEQIDGGRYFVHEHPFWATSWQLQKIEKIMSQDGVERVRGDQCQYGAQTQEDDGQSRRGDPILKPTGFMTNSAAIGRALSKRCEGAGGLCSRPEGGKHRTCSGKHARAAQKYPKELCRALLRGVRDQMHADGLLKNGCYGVQAPDDDAEIEKNLHGPEQGYSGRYRDDLTGLVLKDALVEEARAKEMTFFRSKKVWRKISRQQARARGCKSPISVRWVDVNKGDDMCPNYRSRLVARQMKAMDRSGNSYFAPAPPLEALRTVISLAMTKIGAHQPDWSPLSATRSQLSRIDVKRAYFNAEIDSRDPPTFVQLPREDPDHETMVAQLLRHMYGTRMAADGWQEEYSSFLVCLGFRQGDACPNVFYHSDKQIATSVHGDDFVSSGPATALDWLENAVAEKYEITVEPRMGPGPDDAKEGRMLNRIVRWCEDRITYEADPRQIERLITECGLDGAKAVSTPSVKPTFKELEDDEGLPVHLTTAFRGAAARGNYVAADRPDIQFACKEVCRWMSKPTTQAWKAMKRLCRYLNAAQRLVYEFKQQSVSSIDVYTDTDWAGCPRTRKSTSGGCVMMGRHAVKHWASTQTSVTLSSGEAEFAGVIRGAGQGLGYQALLKDLGIDLPLRVWTDSSAAIGICSRQGLGKLRHLDTHTLWIQQAVRTGRIDLRKVDGEVNPADLFTKHTASRQRLDHLVELFGCRYLEGRAASAPQVKQGDSGRTTMAEADGGALQPQPIRGGTLVTKHPSDGSTSTSTSSLGLPYVDRSAGLSSVGSSRRRSGEADEGINEIEDNTSIVILPHIHYAPDALNHRYPPLQAPDEDHLEDLHDDAHDTVLQTGMAIARGIRSQGQTEGRRRRPNLDDPENR